MRYPSNKSRSMYCTCACKLVHCSEATYCICTTLHLMYMRNSQMYICRSCQTVDNSTLNLYGFVLAVGSFFLCFASSQTYHRADSTMLISSTRISCNRASCLNRGWLVSILVGLSITAVDTYIVPLYGVWPYVSHAFRQSADGSGISS